MWVSLEDVYAAYVDCRKRKRNSESCASFEIDLEKNIYDLYVELNDKSYRIGESIAFCVTKPKVREVFAANFRDRIVHHLIIGKTLKLFEDEFIDDTYNCRKGKGTMKSHERLVELSNQYKDGWCLCCDIKGFFMSIPKQSLADKLEAFLRSRYDGADLEEIVWLTRMVVMHKPQNLCERRGELRLWDLIPKEKSLFTCNPDNGMAIGNLTSQIFANFYLSEFDHMIEASGMGYCRYVDDFRLFSNDKRQLLDAIPTMRKYLADIGLLLHPDKIELQQVRKGIPFVGAVVKQGRLYVGNRTIYNANQMIKSYNRLDEAQIEENIDRFCSRYNSYMGFMVHAKSYAIRYACWNRVSDKVKKYVILKNMRVLNARSKYKSINKIKSEYYGLFKCKGSRFQKV